MDAQLRRGLLEVCVLAAVARHDSYGYQIIREMEPYVEISESTLYPILRRLEAGEMLRVYSVEHSGRLRKYYQITQRGLDRLEEFTLSCVKAGRDSVACFRENREGWKDSVLILGDISAGVVPMEAQLRAWREENGRLGWYLGEQAESVHRLFCGLEQRLK